MSEARRYSKKLRAARQEAGVDDRPTYPPCPCCDGSGQRPVREWKGRYRAGRCRWCDGTGAIEPAVMYAVVYRRWLRIYARNRVMRRCK